MTTPTTDVAAADRAVERLLAESVVGSFIERLVRKLDIAWRDSRSRALTLWLLGR